jgi:hypothetical protein
VFGIIVWASLVVVFGVGMRRLIAAQFDPYAGPDSTPGHSNRLEHVPTEETLDGIPA